MSGYLDEPDSDDDVKDDHVYSDEDIKAGKERAVGLKEEGNAYFSQGEFSAAIEKYTDAMNSLKEVGLPKDSILLLNRSAAFLGIKKYVSALSDANQAATLDPSNWKAYWRKGLALMAMSQRLFRTKMAVTAFQECLKCESLPDSKVKEVEGELRKAMTRLEKQEEDAPAPDLSKCAQS